jgi:hypothetical protein
MRTAIVAAGLSAAVVGLAVAAHQATMWLLFGYFQPIEFGTVWFALGGTPPASLASYGVGGIVATLLDTPLCEVLILGGVVIAWMAHERTHNAHTTL